MPAGLGIDKALTGTATAVLWRRLVPAASARTIERLLGPDDLEQGPEDR